MEYISRIFARKMKSYGVDNRVEYELLRAEEKPIVERYKADFGVSDTFAKQMVKHKCKTPDEYSKKRKSILQQNQKR